MAAEDVSHRTIVPMNFVRVVAAVTVLRPQSAPLRRRRSSTSPKSWSATILSSGGATNSSSSRSRRRASGRFSFSTAAIVAVWSSTMAAMAPQTFRFDDGGAGGCLGQASSMEVAAMDPRVNAELSSPCWVLPLLAGCAGLQRCSAPPFCQVHWDREAAPQRKEKMAGENPDSRGEAYVQACERSPQVSCD